MIRLTRNRSAAALPVSLRQPKLRDHQRKLLDGELAGAHAFSAGIWKKGKDALKAESNGKCAYCEAEVSVVAHGDVEHFRPKSVYWWLAYCFDNHLYACQICNESYKGDAFPVRGAAWPAPKFKGKRLAKLLDAFATTLSPDPVDSKASAHRAFVKAATAERADLIDPYREDPEALFAWEADDTLKEVSLIPRTKKGRGPVIVAAAVKHFGLNREELRRLRWRTLNTVRVLAATIPALPAPERASVCQEIEALMADAAPFAGMVRYFVRDVWQIELT